MTAVEDTRRNLAAAAAEYAARGWPVLPLHHKNGDACSCGRPDCASPAKHPRLAHGLKEASTELVVVSEWWSRWPNANIGLVTGVAFDVLDIDGDEGRANFRQALAEQDQALPEGPRTRTGGGGSHILFATTGGGNRAGILPKVDWRGRNGYIVAPPSIHQSGNAYQWRTDADIAVPVAPQWLAEIVAPPHATTPVMQARPLPAGLVDGSAYGLQALESEIGDLRRAGPGTRNDTLNACAHNLYQLVAGGELEPQVVEYQLRTAAAAIGLGDHEITQTLASGRAAGLAKPRHAPNLSIIKGTRTQPINTGNNDEPSREPERPVLEFLSARQLAEDVDGAPPVGFLFRPLWPADAYGVVAAEKKAGKTWLDLDMVISAASETPWLGVYPVERQGPVLVFLGEGGKRKMLRRLRAICASRGLVFEDLPIELCFRVPHLTSILHLAAIAQKIEDQKPVLVVIDPLYLAARGAKSSSLFDMGEVLETVQAMCQQHDAALCIIHHWNKTGDGKGSERMSGAGPAEWGRVLVSAKVDHRHTDVATKATSVTLELEFVGDEIPDTDLRIRRRVWTDNPDDLNSPMHYTVEELEPKHRNDADPMTPATRRVLAVLAASITTLTVSDIGDVLANDSTGIPLKARTIQASLNELKTLGKAAIDNIDGRTAFWYAHSPTNEDEHDF